MFEHLGVVLRNRARDSFSSE